MPGTDNNITAGITPTSSITPSITMITPTTSANNLNIINNNNNNGNNNGLASLAFYDHSDQELMLQENKYRQYALAIDKALKSFEYTSEWADLVNALGKLNRVLNNNSKFGKIPRRFIVGQRLAQCMHPLLPSGVHLKALETYDLIFNILGPEQLLADLTIYSNGLFPLLGYAAINVRPSVLDLYDRHLLPLGERLQLALDGFLISILPCYEEVSDSFQRTDGLLLKVADGVGIAYFYGALWRCILQNSSIRLQAITFVLMHFNKKRSLKEQAHVLGLCMRTLVQAICSALLDQHILVQRAILDLLITIFPIHFNLMNQVEQTMLSQQQQQQPNNLNISPNKSSTPSQSSQSITPQLPPPPLQPTPQQPVMSRKYFKRSEMIVIITAALTVLLRRDFSLNRRLSAWFFGGDSGASMAGGGGGNSNNNNNANQSTSNNNNIGSFVTTTKSGSTATGTTGTTLLGTSTTIGANNNNNNYDNNLSSTTSTTSTSAETKAKRKKLIYYDTYSKDLVNEAFKRCITNPLTAITSFLPPSALTNSFITFTMPFLPTMGNNDTYSTQTIISSSSSSSPSSSTLSLHTNSRHLYRNNSLHHHHHSNQSRSISSMTGLYQSLYSSMSTFWPYRLLICIMDQRDIAIPILDKLCIDILRGLYHEFELLTTEVPPPNTEINDDNDADDDNDDEENINTSHHSGGNKNQMDRQTNDFIDNISSTTTTTLSSSSPISSTKQTSLNINKKKKRKIINKRKKKKLKKKISTKSNEPVCKLSNNNNNNVTNVNENQQQQQQTKIFDENIIDNNNDVIKSNEQVFNDDDDDDEDVGEINSEALDDIDDALLIDHDDDEEEDEVEDANRSKQQLNADGLISNKNNDDNDNNIGKESTMKLNIHETNSPSLDIFSDDDDLPVSKRDNRNLFQNIRHNVKQKFIKLQFPLGQNKTNDSGSETNSNRNMKQVMKTFMTRPLRLKIRPGDTINDGKLLVNRFGRKKRDQKNINIIDTKNQNQTPIIKDIRYQSANNSSSSTNNANNNASNQNNQNNNNNNKEFDNVDDDDSVFILPHQHYYWNPYYQQLSKEQRQELLQELDRVMHLLFTNIGVEFIWNQLAYDSSEDEDEAEDSFNDDDDDEEEEENNDVGNDTILQSLLWIHNLVPTRLLESLANNYSIGSSIATSCCSSSTLSSSSSSTYASPRLCSPEFKNFNDNDEDLDVEEEEEEEEESDVDDENGNGKKSTLKTKLLISLMNRCRQCGKITKFSSPVQPVGTAWVTILESCTLARFLLGDSKPYPYDYNIDNNGGGGQKFNNNNNNNIDELSSPPTTRIDITNHSTSSLFVNSISVSMNRCSALEPLEVGTANYTFLIHFLDHVLQLICQSVKSFTPIDLRASIELCLALCSKLKPAIMQTFTRRYRRELNVMKNKDFINDTNNVQQSRKPTITTWFETYGQQKQQQPNIRSTHLKTRSSPSVSSNSAKPSNTQLELVREETEEDDEDDNGEHGVVDGILKFFATFIEKILVKKSSNKIETSETIIDYFRRIMLKNITNDQLNIQNIIDRFLINRHQCYYPEIIINCQLLPLYQLFCELLIEIGTIPLLSSPAFLFKKREQKNQINLQQFIIDNNKQQSQQMINKSFDNIRWFIYLMTLTSNGIGSCTHWHNNNNNNEQQTKIKRKSKITTTTTMMDQKSLSCCQLRHVSYTSLATILDLMTMTRAYIVSQPEIYPKPISFGNDEFPMPSYVDMTIIDLFPRTFVARRLNFFPLIHPKMLQFVYESTTWFRLVASGLWSNLSPEDSVLHHSTCALLQQLHSISNDESICEAVICDEMIGGQNNGGTNTMATVQSSSINGSSSYRSFMDGHHQPRFQLSLEQESRQIPNNMNIVHRARNKFALLFSIIRDIRFISERLALVVNALASAARSASDGDIDIGLMNTTGSSVSGAGVIGAGGGGGGISYSDIDPLTINENSSSSKLISQLEIEIATGMDSNHYQSLMNMAIVNNFQDLHRLLRITCPISPIALCSTLKRHFDRPLFIMLDALTQRRNLSDQYSISSDWLLRCIKQSNLFGTKNLMFTSPNGFGVTSEFHNHYLLNNANAAGHHDHHHYLDCDIGRILEPLLFILLHPNTARLSIKNVNILRYTRSNNQSPSAINIDNLLGNYSTRQEISNDSTLETTTTNQEEESKIYAITPTNGNVIYHVRRRPPPPPQPHSRSPTSNVSSTSTYGEHVTMKIITNPMEKLSSSTIQTTDSDCIEQIVQELMDRIVSEIDQDVDIDEFMMTDNKLRTEKKFPGMASSHFIIPTNDYDHHSQPNSTTANVMMGNDFDNIKYRNLINNDDVNVNNNSGRKLRFAEMHQHLLLYERRYDSLRTTYALDTIIAMIETWPSHVLYSMSTSKLFNGSILSFTNNNNNANNNNNSSSYVNCQNISQSSSSLSSIFDGTRSAQIKILYQRHHNSIQGDGFYPNHNQSLNYQSNINLNNMNSTNTATNVGTNRARSRSKQHILESSSTTPATTTTTTLSNDENITLLELIIKICLKYLCSYYPSCPADMASTMTANKLQQKKSPLTRTTGLLEGGLLDDLFLQIRSNHCIDLEAIYGNQRVRLLAAQSLSKIFRNLSQMIENRNHNDRNKHHKRQPSESLLCFNQSKLYAQYLKELFQRCQVQRNILQCLATSVWHYQQKFPSNNPNTTTTNSSKNDNQKRKFKTNPSNITTKRHETSYLFPETKYSTKLNPADILFVKEILDYNDYPENLSTTTTNQFDFYNIKTFNNNHYNDDDDPNNQHGFHDEFEKCLLHLIEQVMILESRIQSALVDTTNVTSGNSKTLSHSDSSSIVQRVSVKEITEMNFDPDLPLLGQTLLNGSLYYALQQNYRRHIHNEWLSFIESSLHYAGRFMPRLVLTAVNQLCRNIDSITKEIEQFARTSCFVSSQLNLPPFVYKHFAQTLQGISMIYSYCLLDRNQFDLLAPVLTELFNDNQDDWSRLFGLTSNRRYRRRYFDINNSFINEQWTLSQNGNMATSVSNNESTGAIQAISSILHNFMVMPISGSNTTGTTSGGSNSSTVTTSTNDQTDQSNPTDSDIVISQQDTLPNNLALTRQRILDYTSLNRVLTALFQVWCTMIVREEINNNGQTLQTTSLINQQQSACCHPYVRQFYSIDTNHNRNNEKNCRYSQSNCSLGWSSSIYTGWYITGSSMMLGQAIVTILNIVAVSNGISLMKSIARVWHDLRDRSLPVNNSNPTNDSSLLADSIDMVITPATSAQQKLVQLISSLQPILNLEYLIQIVRAVLKPSSSISTSSTSTTTTTTTAATVNSSTSSASSITTEVESTQHSFTSNPFDNIFLIEVSLLEFFLAYIRTCPGELLLKVCRSMIALIKDSFALNLTASVPYETFWPRSKQRQPIIPSSSVQINFQPLINIHLLAIMHHFVVASPSVEDRRAQKELQDVTQRLIDANISVAGGRLLPSRFWSFRRNFEVMPVNSDHQIGHHHQQYQQQQQQQTGRPSPTATHRSGSASTTPITEEALSNSHNEQNISFKRGLFRSSASVQFQPDRSPSNTIQRTMTPTHDDYHHLSELQQQQQQQQQQDSLLFGLFNFNLSYLSTGSNQSNHQDLANTSQNLFYSYFCIKALYAMAEFAAPVLDVVYASEEKEKMIPLITNLMSYVIPYLKSHSQHNLPCFDACSRLLASFSGYQYTRKAWRRDSLELLLDPAFFQMPPECLQSWRTIIDHLMTHDKNTFREFLQRMSIAQSPSVSFKIFVPSSTKDQESEPRAQLVKRLAFILFCSEKDQYQRYMAEIQEKLIEIHRTSQQQSQSSSQLHSQSILQSQVLLAFRVILLRMSPHYLASLWPFIYTEMFQVFLSIEQALLKVIRDEQKNDPKWSDSATISPYNIHLDIPDFLATQSSIHRSSSSSNFLQQHRTSKLEPKIPTAQLQLFLNACKLLDLALLLPSDILPQFQLHKWAFINTDSFPLSTNIRQPIDWLGGISPFAEPIVLNLQTDSSIISNISQQSSEQQTTSSTSSLGMVENLKSLPETISLNSTITFDSPQSLPANLNSSSSLSCSSTITLNHQCNNNNNNEATFIPHVVFINHLLNYLTDSIPIISQSNVTMCPLLTMSTIESIHDLHPFFAAVLSRSNQNTMFTTSTQQQQQQHCNQSNFERQPNESSSTSSSSYRRSLENRTHSANASINSQKQQQQSDRRKSSKNNGRRKIVADQLLMNNCGGCSLDELYINIDRIIANDFLEPLPSSSTNLSSD
ncbi:Protein dopey-1 [Dermatophagoides pteronyssinus]|uniref:Protein dopey-1 n=1 Tax=Dermatophagoides pteronyssinus TaxID=6956 RepID=A0ABQ8JS08_DERPT|nr:Protein dopey-1 [Dermatophagoides pteronyssinus]